MSDGGIAACHDERVIMKSAHAHSFGGGDESSHGWSLRDLPILLTMGRRVKLFPINAAYASSQWR